MVLILGLAASVLLFVPLADARDDEFKPPTTSYSDVRSFQSGCDAVWTAAMPLLTELGLAEQTLDRQGGYASMKWSKGENVSFGSKDDFKRLTMKYSKSWPNYDIFRIEAATLFVIPEAGGCKGQLKMTYMGRQSDAFSGSRWNTLESNHSLEQTLLGKIGEQIGSQGSGSQTPVVGQPAPQKAPTSATVSVTSNPTGGDIEIDRKLVGSTPSKIDLKPGKHQIQVKKSGHRDWRQNVDVLAGMNLAVAADLVPIKNEKPVVVAVPDVSPRATQPTAAVQPTAAEKPAVEAKENIAVEKAVGSHYEGTTSVPSAPVVAGSVKEVESVKIVCTDRFSEVPFSSSRPDRKTLACGEPVTIIKQVGLWIRVRTKDGLEGSVATRFVGK